MPFSLCGMEKEKLIPTRKVFANVSDAEEDRNADTIITKLSVNDPLSEIIDLLNTRKINFDSYVKVKRAIYTILRCTLERCDPNNEEDVKFVALVLQKTSLKQQFLEDSDWEPYLFYAIEKAAKNNMNLTIVKLLVEHGADVNFRFVNKEGNGKSALHWAVCCFNGDMRCIDYLLEEGADTNALSGRKYTPLAILAGRFDLKNEPKINLIPMPHVDQCELLVKRLLEYGADINKKQKIYNWDKKNRTKQSNYEMLKPLMPNLDTIIKKTEEQKRKALSDKKHAGDFIKGHANNLGANFSTTIKKISFKVNQEILSARCPSLCLAINPYYKNENDLVIKEIG